MSEIFKQNLDKKAANKLLDNVLDSCNLPPSTKTLDEMMFQSALARKPLQISRFIAIAFLILAVLAPLAFNQKPDFVLVNSLNTVAVSSHILYDDCFIITLTGNTDYSNVLAKKDNGAIIYPAQIDETSGLVIFPYDGDALNIYIPSRSGGCIQAVLSEKK